MLCGVARAPVNTSKLAIRNSNLAAVLRVVVRRRLVSRASISEELGLSRSTVSELIAQLVQLGYVVETVDAAGGGVGRPSHVVAPSRDIVTLVIDPERDRVAVGAIGLNGELHSIERVPDPPFGSPEAVCEIAVSLLRDIVSRLPSRARLLGCAVAVPGQVETPTGVIASASGLGWKDLDLRCMLEEALGIPVRTGNNARLVMVAENRFGVAVGDSDIVTIFAEAGGIGGGLIVGDQPVVGAAGFAGEIGQLKVALPDPSGSGMRVDTFCELVKVADLERTLALDNPTGAELDHHIQTSDSPDFLQVAQHQVAALTSVLADLVNLLDPQRIVLGGFLGSLYRRFQDSIAEDLARQVVSRDPRRLTICTANDTTEMQMLGAAQLLWDELVDDPLGYRLSKPWALSRKRAGRMAG